jgi:hypothetical protein
MRKQVYIDWVERKDSQLLSLGMNIWVIEVKVCRIIRSMVSFVSSE